MAQILVADDEAALRDFIAEVLRGEGHQVRAVRDGAAALGAAREERFDLLITDLRMPRMPGIELLRALHDEQPDLPAIVLTAHGRVDVAVEAMKLGALDFLEKPLPGPDALRLLVRRALAGAGEARAAAPAADEPVWDAPVMRPVVSALRKVARTDATVLLLGESGTGKEVCARALHRHSRRSNGPFVAVNGAALSETLLESELFGHEKGAFTGAVDRSRGQLEHAAGGTFFLDEVGELGPSIQARLLRVLQERTFRRVGGREVLQADVRFVAATNRDLRAMVQDGTFREDLYHRLAVFPITLPPLRQRREDVWPLAERLLGEVARDHGQDGLVLDPACRAPLEEAPWPGNVRELRNVLERAAILAEDGVVRPDDLVLDGMGTQAPPPASAPAPTLEQAERAAIVAALELHDGHRKKAAEHLGIGLRTLYDKLKKYGLS